MKEMGWTFEDIKKLSGKQIAYVIEAIKRYYKERESEMRKARSRSRRRR